LSLYSICNSIENIGLLTDVRETPWVYPIIMSIHLVCIAVFGGMILMTDLRLLGVGLKDKTATEVVGGLRPFKRIGFVVMVTCGLLMAGSQASDYYQNPYFWTKMALLVLVGVHAMVFKPTVYDHPEKLDESPVLPTRAKAAAVISLILWVSIPVCGRLIAYYEPDESKAHQAAAETLRAVDVLVPNLEGGRPRCRLENLAVASLWQKARVRIRVAP
jgi:uncharacterized membrane protein